jgi:4-hydroxy-3-methylbut-2-enyl diphosphate reductase IspH
MEEIKSADLVGITAGASTPQKLIEEVQNNVRGTYF